MADFTGSLDTRVRFERKVEATGLKSAGSETWEPVVTIWANVQDVLPSRSERLVGEVDIASRPARIRTKYRTDLTSYMRIVMGRLDRPDQPPPPDRRTLQIVAGPAVLGRKDGLEFMATEYSTGA